LDVGVFGPLQHAWYKHCEDVLDQTGEEMARADFINEYMVAHEKVFTTEIISKAWKNSGIWPFLHSIVPSGS
jgi:hypothetical protein